MSEAQTPSGITVAEGKSVDRANHLAATLSAAYGVEVSHVHIDTVPPATDRTPEEALALAIAAAVPDDHVLVIESERADRWRSRHSVAEHVIDAHTNMTVAIGPATVEGPLRSGPMIVALDGSPTADSALPAARDLADAVERTLLLVRVIPAPLHPELTDSTTVSPRKAATSQLSASASRFGLDADIVVLESNDPVSALVEVGEEREASFIALSSSGDRESARTTMSRTAAGLIAEAGSPVFIAHSGAD